MAQAYLRVAGVLVATLLLSGCALPRWGNKEITLYDHEEKVFRAFMPADGKIRYESKDGMKVEIDNRGAESPFDKALLGAVIMGIPQAATGAAVHK